MRKKRNPRGERARVLRPYRADPQVSNIGNKFRVARVMKDQLSQLDTFDVFDEYDAPVPLARRPARAFDQASSTPLVDTRPRGPRATQAKKRINRNDDLLDDRPDCKKKPTRDGSGRGRRFIPWCK